MTAPTLRSIVHAGQPQRSPHAKRSLLTPKATQGPSTTTLSTATTRKVTIPVPGQVRTSTSSEEGGNGFVRTPRGRRRPSKVILTKSDPHGPPGDLATSKSTRSTQATSDSTRSIMATSASTSLIQNGLGPVPQAERSPIQTIPAQIVPHGPPGDLATSKSTRSTQATSDSTRSITATPGGNFGCVGPISCDRYANSTHPCARLFQFPNQIIELTDLEHGALVCGYCHQHGHTGV